MTAKDLTKEQLEDVQSTFDILSEHVWTSDTPCAIAVILNGYGLEVREAGE